MNRIVAIVVAVVFVLGTACVPGEVAFAEEEPVATEAAAPVQTEEPDVTAPVEEQQPVQAEELVQADLEDLDESEYDGFIYKLEDDTTKADVQEMNEEIADLGDGQKVEPIVKNELYVADSLETIEEVVAPENVEYVEPNYIRTLSEEDVAEDYSTLAVTPHTPNDAYYKDYRWIWENTAVPRVWATGQKGSGITVAVVDSGINRNHNDFAKSTILPGYNAFTGTMDVTDTVGHGTAVAGMIAASMDNQLGIAGFMPEVSIYPIKIFGNSNETTDEHVVGGVYKAIQMGVDVINLSLGGTSYSRSLDIACEAAAGQGIIVVAAAGNDGDRGNPVNYPAAQSNTISVGAVDKDNNKAAFSTYNNMVDVVAPGQGVVLLGIGSNGSYTKSNGTSFACPIVSALAAMARAESGKQGKSMKLGEFRTLLQNTADDLGAPGKDPYFGYGIANFEDAYSYIKGGAHKWGASRIVKKASFTTNGIIEQECTDTGCAVTQHVKIPRVYYAGVTNPGLTYNGKVQQPGLVLRDAAGNSLDPGVYSYYISSGKNVGIYPYSITINSEKYSGTKKGTFSINPKGTTIRKPSRGSRSFTAKWKKQKAKMSTSRITGYQVMYSTKSSFSDGKIKTVKGYKKTSCKIKKLKKKKKYYVKVRTYKNTSGGTCYSAWSKTKTVKTR